MGHCCPQPAFRVEIAAPIPAPGTTPSLPRAAAGRVCSSPGPQDRVWPGVSNSAMTLMPRSRAYSITVRTSLAVYTWVIALKAPWEHRTAQCLAQEQRQESAHLSWALHGDHYLLAELWECGALIGERWVIHNVPVEHIELVVSHDVLGRNRYKDEHAPSLQKGHPSCHR